MGETAHAKQKKAMNAHATFQIHLIPDLQPVGTGRKLSAKKIAKTAEPLMETGVPQRVRSNQATFALEATFRQ